jgi:hypothetical protein
MSRAGQEQFLGQAQLARSWACLRSSQEGLGFLLGLWRNVPGLIISDRSRYPGECLSKPLCRSATKRSKPRMMQLTTPELRTEFDFCDAFRVQHDALKISGAAYDIGFHGECARLATAIWVLIGLGNRSHTSLVEHLNWHTELRLRSTMRPGDGGGMVSLRAKVIEEVDGKPAWNFQCRPRGAHVLDEIGRELTLEEWWKEPIARSATRSTFVRILRDKEGGAHYDDKISDADFLAAKQQLTIELEPGNVVPAPMLAAAKVRQITFEVLDALDVYYMRAGNGTCQ